MLKAFLLKYCRKNQNISSQHLYTSLLKHQNICHEVSIKYQILSEKLQTITKEKKECVILGDLNANYNKIEHQKVIKKLFIDNGFEQSIKLFTRITSKSETLINVVLTNSPNNISHTGVITAGLNDHRKITCTRKMNNIRYQPSTITFRDFSKYNIDTINNELFS